jgi:hypothetical protein
MANPINGAALKGHSARSSLNGLCGAHLVSMNAHEMAIAGIFATGRNSSGGGSEDAASGTLLPKPPRLRLSLRDSSGAYLAIERAVLATLHPSV